MTFQQILREPVLHFVLIGIGLFALYDRVAPETADSRRIEIGEEQVAQIVRMHEATWSRPPSPEELDSLIEARIRDEVMYREGLALGLDADDPVIKRRVRQKLEISAEELMGRAEPTAAELEAYFAENLDKFVPPTRISFEQVLVPADRAEGGQRQNLAIVHSALIGGAKPSLFRAPSMLPDEMTDAPIDQVEREFGQDFAHQLLDLAPGEWEGPVASGFGRHLVRVSATDRGAPPELDQVLLLVQREWENDRRLRNRELAYREMRANYRITVATGRQDGSTP